ncbi:MAG: TIGR01244 family phosphatase, partial [Woeseiaceae bacterium]|nr:TIGR01244 family phosphatase [Woeseiaceae bacterium]
MQRFDLSETYTVAGQVSVGDIASLSESGFTTVICNRP